MRIEGMDASSWQTSISSLTNKTEQSYVRQQASVEIPENESTKVSEAFIRKAVDKANETMQEHGRSLEFRVHERTNEIIVKIIDTNTKEVIREIPSEKILDMFANMLELAGLLVDERR